MKFCPYCGADLIDGAVSFCAECGKSLPDRAEEKSPALKETKIQPQKKKGAHQSKPKRNKRKLPADAEPQKAEVRKDGYDGYYDDVLPADIDREKEGIDKELIKKIAAVVGAMLLIVGLCVVAMYLL